MKSVQLSAKTYLLRVKRVCKCMEGNCMRFICPLGGTRSRTHRRLAIRCVCLCLRLCACVCVCVCVCVCICACEVKVKVLFIVGGQTGKDCFLTWADGVKVADPRDRTRTLALRKRSTNHCTTGPHSGERKRARAHHHAQVR